MVPTPRLVLITTRRLSEPNARLFRPHSPIEVGPAHARFARFRHTKRRLQVSLVETRRDDGRVLHEHIASLGSVETPPSVDERMTFWARLHERLAKLSNRVDAATQAKLLGDIHARIPMVTLEEQRSLKLVNAEGHERFWTGLHGMHEAQHDAHKKLLATAQCSRD